MSSMVSEYIIRPALQQVRRFSRSSAVSEAEPPTTLRKSSDRPPSRDDAFSETEEDSYLKDGDESTSPPASSRSSVTPNLEYAAVESEAHPNLAVVSQFPAVDSSQNATSTVSETGGTNVSDGQTTTRERDTSDVSMTSAPETELSGADGQAADAVISVPPAAERPDALPEDDGMGALRKRILEIQSRKLPAPEQAKLIHQVLMEGYKKSKVVIEIDRSASSSSGVGWEQKQSQGVLDTFLWQHLLGEDAPTERFHLTEDDIKPTFASLKPGEEESEYRALGCEHYRRNVKSECSTCGRWHTCRFCHDKVEGHQMSAKDTKNMLCMYCGAAQKVGEACVRCGETAAMYYCSICKLWNNDPDRSIYHCPDCGICRVGRGLGKDFFHCKKCNACLNINFENRHRCIERLLDCDCPICGEYMFNTTRGICHMKCGHTLHKDCWDEHIKHAYKCPICNKSIVNMETQFRRLDIAIETQPMPEKFQDTRAVVSCNDCSAKTTVKYHWLGLKCAVCQSYNTSQIQILGTDADTLEQTAATANEAQLPDSMVSSNADLLQSSTASVARDIPRRRRHSSNLLQLNLESLDMGGAPDIGSYVVQERFARSVSPAAAMHPVDMDDSDDDKEDMIGLWSRVPRSITSNDDQEEEYDSDDDSVSSLGDDMDEDDNDEDEINLFGHR
ncbi:CHY zinc finger [Seiridium cupressi]